MSDAYLSLVGGGCILRAPGGTYAWKESKLPVPSSNCAWTRSTIRVKCEKNLYSIEITRENESLCHDTGKY
jgi:hypothetical protein